ncbi:MAG: Alanine dehydrogenase [Alphaproteobacteria bacterium MarineAlpha5_Bin9]|nr:MAG: Alanine dehydrogenase [Alphaproteobacteria bacterium MarineAlpha5_Bin9]|tara:strand:- start:2049 stop:3164 length:1116 start_codon:yes stop_codon:yes gene_type:complete
MIIGVPKEIKTEEYRVGLTPSSVKKLTDLNHEVLIEQNAGFGAGFTNNDYSKVGAKIIKNNSDVFSDSNMIVKVKEPQLEEVKMLKDNQILFTYLHLSAAPNLTKGLVDSGSICIAYETVTDKDNRLPLLAPMSAVAGRMSIQAGANSLEKTNGGRGLLIGGAPGVLPGNVLILGGGVVGENAAIIATGMKAKVFIMDKSEKRLDELSSKFGESIIPINSDKVNLEDYLSDCDLLIGGVLVPGANAPKLVSREMLKLMKKGSVIVDVAIDQGGCVATSRPTTHSSPTYIEENIVHYCVANMPGGVPRTSTIALNSATIPYIIKLAQNGYRSALLDDDNFLAGLNIFKGEVTHKAVAKDLNYKYVPPINVLN